MKTSVTAAELELLDRLAASAAGLRAAQNDVHRAIASLLGLAPTERVALAAVSSFIAGGATMPIEHLLDQLGIELAEPPSPQPPARAAPRPP